MPASPPSELVAFVERQIRDSHHRRDDRRDEGRIQLATSVVAWRVDESGNPIGEPIALVTRDISPHGMSLVSVDALPLDQLALRFELAGETVTLIADMLWTQECGPFYLSGGKFSTWAPKKGIADALPSMEPIQTAMKKQCGMVGGRRESGRFECEPEDIKAVATTA